MKKSPKMITDSWKFDVGETITDYKSPSIKIQIVSRGPFVTDKHKVQEVYLVKSTSGPTLFTLLKDEVDRNYRRTK
jgi:hypothetical protein